MKRLHLALSFAICVVAGGTSGVLAQDRPTVFVHGLKSSPDTWAGAASRLATQLAIEPHLPPVSWEATYETQASQVQGRLWWLPASTVAIGHSNGGIVAREWSRHRPLGGLVTLGTPNQGAPLVTNLGLVAHFQSTMGWLVSDVHSAFAVCCDWDGVWPTVEWWMAVTYWMGHASLQELIASLGVSIGAPVVAQMAPTSAYLRDLNGGNVNREAAAVPARVAIASAATNFYDLGILGAVGGTSADYLNSLAEGTEWALNYYAMVILSRAGAGDPDAYRKASRMWNLAAWLGSWDEVWCRAVSIQGASFCTANDSVVPTWSQVMPGPGVQVLDWGWWGPRHTLQTASSDDKLYQALAGAMRVPVRGTSGGGNSGGGSDPGSTGALETGDALYPGQSLWSRNRGAQLVYQHDGNLVVYRADGCAVWASHTAGTSAGNVVMQWDGNLVVYDGSGRAVWASQTAGHERARLVLQDDGVMVIYASNGAPVWSSGW